MEEQHQPYLLTGVIIFVFLVISALAAGLAGLLYLENGGDLATVFADNGIEEHESNLTKLELECDFYNPNLVLNQFEFEQPEKYIVTNCEDDNIAANYISFLAYDTEENLFESIGLGFYTKAQESTHTSRVDLLNDIAGNLRLQLPEGSIIEGYTPDADKIILAKGEFTKQDYRLELTAAAGEFAPGEYLLRLVTLTTENSDHGVLAVVMSHIEKDIATTQAELNNGDAFTVLDTLDFAANSADSTSGE